MSNNNEEKMTQLFIYPYDAFLMIRLEFIMVCQDELQAKILRIIEKYTDQERKRIYRETINKSGPPPHGEVLAITEDIWVPISHKLFKNDLYGTVASENTLKKAIKDLMDKKIIFRRHNQTQRYDAPEYKIHVNVLQMLLDVIGDPGGQKLIPSIIDTLKKSPPQELTPSECQKLIPSSDLRGSKIDTNITKVTNNNIVITNKSNTDDPENNTSASPLSRDATLSLQENENENHNKTQELIEKLREWRVEDAQQEEDTLSEQGDTNVALTHHSRGDLACVELARAHTDHHLTYNREETLQVTPPEQGANSDQKTDKNRDLSAVNPPVEPTKGRTAKAQDASTAQQNHSASELPAHATAVVGEVAVSQEVLPLTPTKPSRKPSKSKVNEARVDVVFDCMDATIRELTDNPEWRYTRPKTDRKIITDFITHREIKAAQLRAVMSAMYNTPKDEKSGFYWRENMSVKAIFNNYDRFCITLHSKQNGKPSPPSNIYGNLKPFDVSLYA